MRKYDDKSSEHIRLTIGMHIIKYGFSPSYRDLCDMCNLTSTSTVNYHIHKLNKLGLILLDNHKIKAVMYDNSKYYIHMQSKSRFVTIYKGWVYTGFDEILSTANEGVVDMYKEYSMQN